jgi:multicomponent Na+:H+ antiporter subunit E
MTIMLLANISLALVWALLTGVFSVTNLTIGFALGYATLWAVQRTAGPTSYFGKVRQALSFTVFYLGELVLANLRVAADVLSPRPHRHTRIVALPIEAHTHLEIWMLVNLISLTPGTLILDISTDRRVLYIHALHAETPESLQRDIKNGLERRLLELLRDKPAEGMEARP